MKWLENLFNINEKKFKFIFWFISFLTIPVFAYIYVWPFSLLVALLSELFGLSEKSKDIISNFVVILCLIFTIGTHWYLWKMHKNKKV